MRNILLSCRDKLWTTAAYHLLLQFLNKFLLLIQLLAINPSSKRAAVAEG